MAIFCPAKSAKFYRALLNAWTAALDIPEVSGALEESFSALKKPKN